jgi:hypothetical protein
MFCAWRVALVVASCGCAQAGDDADGDGFTADEDCDDNDAEMFPGAVEVWYDGVVQDCESAADFPLTFERVPLSQDGTDPIGPRFARGGGEVEIDLLFANGGVSDAAARAVTIFDESTGAILESLASALAVSFGTPFAVGGTGLDVSRRESEATSLVGVSALPDGEGPKAYLLQFHDDGSWTSAGWGPGGTREHFNDVALSDDGGAVSIAACGLGPGVQWVSGTIAEFASETYEHLGLPSVDFDRCEVQGADVRAVGADGIVTEYSTASGELEPTGENWSDVLAVAWEQDAFLTVRTDEMTLDLAASQEHIATSAVAARVRMDVAPDGGVYVVYATDTGDLYLIYGDAGRGWTEVLLETAIAKTDLDVEASRDGLFIGARTRQDTWVATLDRRD